MNTFIFNPLARCKHTYCKRAKSPPKFDSRSCLHSWNHLNKCIYCNAKCSRDEDGKIVNYDAGVL